MEIETLSKYFFEFSQNVCWSLLPAQTSIRDTYRLLDRPCFGLNCSATRALEVNVQLWGHFVQLWVSHLVDWFATCTQEVSVQLWGNIVQL